MSNKVMKFLDTAYKNKPEDLIVDEVTWRYLMRSILRGKNVMLTGPSGTAKTLAVTTAAKMFDDRPFFRFNLGATQDPKSTIIGNTHYSPEKGTFVTPSLFVKAIQTENAIILLDELTRAHPDAHNILMSVLDPLQRYLRMDDDPDTPTIEVAKGVSFCATANIGTEYSATRELDRALQDRFIIVEMDYLSQDNEKVFLNMRHPELPEDAIGAIASVAAHTRTQLLSDDPQVSTALSSRYTLEMAGLMEDGFTFAHACQACVYPLFSRAGGNESERSYMKKVVQMHIAEDGEGLIPTPPDLGVCRP